MLEFYVLLIMGSDGLYDVVIQFVIAVQGVGIIKVILCILTKLIYHISIMLILHDIPLYYIGGDILMMNAHTVYHADCFYGRHTRMDRSAG
jgi:hypothetical protein